MMLTLFGLRTGQLVERGRATVRELEMELPLLEVEQLRLMILRIEDSPLTE